MLVPDERFSNGQRQRGNHYIPPEIVLALSGVLSARAARQRGLSSILPEFEDVRGDQRKVRLPAVWIHGGELMASIGVTDLVVAFTGELKGLRLGRFRQRESAFSVGPDHLDRRGLLFRSTQVHVSARIEIRRSAVEPAEVVSGLFDKRHKGGAHREI